MSQLVELVREKAEHIADKLLQNYCPSDLIKSGTSCEVAKDAGSLNCQDCLILTLQQL